MLGVLVLVACSWTAQDPFPKSLTGNELAECLQMGPYITDDDPNGDVSRQLMVAFQKLNRLSTDALEDQMVQCMEDGWRMDKWKQRCFMETLDALDEYLFDVPRKEMWRFTKEGELRVQTGHYQSSGPPVRPLTRFRSYKDKYPRRWGKPS